VIIKPIALLNLVGLMALELMRSIPKTVHAFIMVIALVLVAQPAQAAPKILPTAEDPMSYIGCPTIAWATPLQGTAQEITGMIGGFIVVAALVLMFLAGIALLFARNNQMKANGAIESAKNIGLGLVFTLIGVPVLAAIVWVVATLANPNCR